MCSYLSILKIEIREIIANNRYTTLEEMKDYARRRKIELEIQTKEKRQSLVP